LALPSTGLAGLALGPLKKFRGGVKQLADAQIDYNIPTRDAFRDVIRGVAALPTSEFLG
jgi:hypothetical protein